MNCPCSKFGDCSFSSFGFYSVDRQTLTHTDTDDHCTLMTPVGVSNIVN